MSGGFELSPEEMDKLWHAINGMLCKTLCWRVPAYDELVIERQALIDLLAEWKVPYLDREGHFTTNHVEMLRAWRENLEHEWSTLLLKMALSLDNS